VMRSLENVVNRPIVCFVVYPPKPWRRRVDLWNVVIGGLVIGLLVIGT
jgi:hypothetical protein